MKALKEHALHEIFFKYVSWRLMYGNMQLSKIKTSQENIAKAIL